MNTVLNTLDEALLNYTKKITGRIYRLFGITNFEIARHLCITGLCLNLLFFTFCMIGDIPIGEKIFLVPFLLFLLFLTLMHYLATILAERKNRIGHLNKNRIFCKWDRIRGVLLVLPLNSCLLFQNTSKLFSNEIFTTIDIGFLLQLVSNILVFCFVPCLISVESEPPSESKLKKAIGKLRELFSPNPLPQGC